MTISASDVISAAAFLFGIANSVFAWQNRKRRMEDELSQLLDGAEELLLGREGYSKTKNETKYLEAEKMVGRAIRINPNDPRTVELNGLLFDLKGKKKQALQWYNHSIELNPNRARPYNWAGSLLMGGDGSKENFEKAKESFEHAIRLEPDRADRYYYNLGVLYYNHQKLDDAKLQLEHAIEQAPQNTDAHVFLGDILLLKKQTDEARQHYEKAIDADPNNADAHAKLANILRAAGNAYLAQLHYEKAIGAEPNHIGALVSLGALLSGKPETAKVGIALVERASKVNPMDTYPLQMLAAIYADGKEPEKAIHYAEIVTSIDEREKLKGTTTRDLLEAMQIALQAKSTAADPLPADAIPVTQAGDAKLPEKKGAPLALAGLPMIHFACPSCHKKMKAAESAAGKAAKCPSCGAAVPIPIASETPTSEHTA
jgi:tetratricopeptide (TPR) repeat protein